jgi:hypothetical protein
MKKRGTSELKLSELASAYMRAKRHVIDSGYAYEIDWQDAVAFDSITERDFLREAAWVVLSCGMRESVIRSKFPAISLAFLEWESAERIVTHRRACYEKALGYFNHHKKMEAILNIAEHVLESKFPIVQNFVRQDGIGYLMQLPYMGPATSRHFAKNIGLSMAKPDRHLVRIAIRTGYQSPQTMCGDIAATVGDKVAVVDLVLWRYATLHKNYLDLFLSGARKREAAT